jgi:orotate phosphoribosyltransferase
MELGELRDVAATLFGMIPGFVYTAGYPAAASPRISEIPVADFGPAVVGTIHFAQHLTHRGHQIERYEHVRKLWGVTETAVSVKINVPTVWPVLMIAAKQIASERGRDPRFDDGVVAGQTTFDRLYACGTPRPDFARRVLTEEFTDLLVDGKENRRSCVIFQSEVLTPENDGVPAETKRGGVWVSDVGELADQELANRLTELACDLIEALPAGVAGYHVDDSRQETPADGWEPAAELLRAAAGSHVRGSRPVHTLDLTAKGELARLITELAVVHGRVTLSSGKEADYYVDLRRATLHHAAAPLIGRLLRQLTADWDYVAAGGLTLGADPVACAMMHAASSAGEVLDVFVVRKEAKSHGMQRRIEGIEVAGQPVLAVEDTSTTGGSVLKAVDALVEAGAKVIGVATVVDRDTGAREAIEARGLPYRYLLDKADLGL